MSSPWSAIDAASSTAVPRFLVELPSLPRSFFGNLGALFSSTREKSLALLSSAPGEFWPDVFVKRRFPWSGLLQSIVYHGLGGAALIALTQLFAMQPRVVATANFDHSQVVYYTPSEYLPPLDTRDPSSDPPRKADPELAPQPIISVPREADNRSQTIVSPPNVKLNRDVAVPNMVAWADETKPRLFIPDAPLTPAADLARMAPTLESSVVAPAPDAAHLNQSRSSLALQNSVVAPPPDLRASNATGPYPGLQPDLIAPPPAVDRASARRVGDLTIAQSAVIAPAPQLPVAAQRSLGGGRVPGVATQVVAPPPAVSGGSSGSFGSRGRVIALSMHPAVGAPPDAPAGNRRGTFAAGPEGHAGAPGNSGSAAGTGTGSASRTAGTGNGSGSGSSTAKANDLPAGLYVGKTSEKTSPVAGNSAAPNGNSVNPNLLGDARHPRVSSTPAQPAESAAKLSEPEREVFAGKKFYALTLNMPNLNSAGGSWIVRFAELKHPAADAKAPDADLSQPMAIRKVDPAYPIQLMRENVGGTVILYAVIHSDGHVSDVRVLRGADERLDRYASEALEQWKFQPATKNGSPVAVEATFQIPFRPGRAGVNF
jgi:TonB family protein